MCRAFIIVFSLMWLSAYLTDEFIKYNSRENVGVKFVGNYSNIF